MNIVFFGTPLFAKDIVEGLAHTHNILAIITQPDKPFGRKKIMKAPETKTYAMQTNIAYFQPQKNTEIYSILESIHQQTPIHAIIVVAYGKILPKEVVTSYICINLHGSILPYFRGASPIQSSILADYKHFGLTAIRMNEGLDSGDILEICRIDREIVVNQTLDSVFRILVPYGISVLEHVLLALQTHNLKPIPQNHDNATYCHKFSKHDAYLDLEDSKSCYLRYLALHTLGVWIHCNSEIIKLNRIIGYEYKQEHEKKGQILAIQNNTICISCKKGELWIESVTPQNKSLMSAISFLQSKNLKIGDNIT